MPAEHSCGAVVYRKNKKIKYLLLQYSGGYWEFPRGNIEENEDEKVTALREIEEETGIKDAKIKKGFREKTSWFYKKEGKTIYKDVVFLLAETKTEKVKLSFEHKDCKWLEFDEALKQLKFKNSKEILEKVNKFLA